MLFALAFIQSCAFELWVSHLIQQIEKSCILIASILALQIELEVDEKILIVDIFKFENAHVCLFLFVNLHVAVVAHDSFVKTTR